MWVRLFFAIIASLTAACAASASSLETTIYKFKPGTGDGYQPAAGLITDSHGNLYGTTLFGGQACQPNGCGTVYELSSSNGGKTWIETILYSFRGTPDGAYPAGALVFDTAGNLYGTTSGGGSSRDGTIFRLSPPAKKGNPWTETILHKFNTNNNGYFPVSLTIDNAGNLYGEDPEYPGGFGNVFELSPNGKSWSFKVLYNFKGGAKHDGTWPVGNLVLTPWGALYGFTTAGGTGGGCNADGCGTVFQLVRQKNGSWTEKVIYRFAGGSDGGVPVGLSFDHVNAAMYGATSSGGNETDSGAVFQLTPVKGGGWTQSVIYSFGAADGLGFPRSGVVVDSKGNLYGTTYVSVEGDGGIYKLSPPQSNGDWTETTQYRFTGGPGGGKGPSGLILNNTHTAVLGVTEYGGLPSSGGVVFKMVLQ